MGVLGFLRKEGRPTHLHKLRMMDIVQECIVHHVVLAVSILQGQPGTCCWRCAMSAENHQKNINRSCDNFRCWKCRGWTKGGVLLTRPEKVGAAGAEVIPLTILKDQESDLGDAVIKGGYVHEGFT